MTFESLNGNSLDAKQSYELTARFASIKELKSGDEVRMAGVGVVKATRLNGRFAEAQLQISNTIAVPADAVATIAMSGLLGSNYVALTLGNESAPPLEPGNVMRSEDTPDLNTIVSQVGEIGRKVEQALSQFSGAMGDSDSGDGTSGKLNAIVDENRLKIETITSNLEIVTTRLRDGEGTLGKLLSDDSGYTELAAAIEEIRGAATEARTFMTSAQALIDQAKSGEGTIGTLLYDDSIGENIRLTSQNLVELSQKLNQGEGTLGRLINDDSLFIEAQNAVQKVNRAVDGLADQGPITVVGVAANSLF
ncbi:MAG: MCE family protein [Candidatus Synoicihabitans palmerolidicus]|nr:MCE family protein [Candidatus Synoicihabitans palmerolidicus]